MSMSTLIVPCCGEYSFGVQPSFLCRSPDGRIFLTNVIRLSRPEQFEKVLVVTYEHLRHSPELAEVLGSFNNAHPVFLQSKTASIVETVSRAIEATDISGPIVVKDADVLCDIILPKEGNFVLGIGIGDFRGSIADLGNSSFVVINENGIVQDIIEKEVKSDKISVGVYGFESADSFIRVCSEIQKSQYPFKKLFCSHLIDYFIACEYSVFRFLHTAYYGSVPKKSEERKRVLALDLDGTLFNTDEVNFRSYAWALSQEGIVLSRDFFKDSMVGKHYSSFLPRLGLTKEQVERVHTLKTEAYSRFLTSAHKNTFLFDVCKSLKKQYRLACVTTASKKNCMEILGCYGAKDLFDFIITGDDVSEKKPNSECYNKLLSLARIDGDDLVVFEDSEDGVLSAKGVTEHVYTCRDLLKN